MGKIRLLLADDHATMLAPVRSTLGEAFDVVGGVRNGRDAVDEVQRLDSDVLVIDISMPVLNGWQAVSEPQSKKCRTKVVLLTVHQGQDWH
jgi:DNA-binding NarL/FixJ family response regulator